MLVSVAASPALFLVRQAVLNSAKHNRAEIQREFQGGRTSRALLATAAATGSSPATVAANERWFLKEYLGGAQAAAAATAAAVLPMARTGHAVAQIAPAAAAAVSTASQSHPAGVS